MNNEHLEEIKDIILDVKDSLNETPKNMYKYTEITFNLNELSEILKEVEVNMIEEINGIHDYYIKQLQEQDDEIEDLQQKVEQLENIRKEIKKEIKKYAYTDNFGDTVVLAKYIEDILNKGEKK